MPHQLPLGSERPVAQVALERAFARVGAHVRFELPHVDEPPLAQRAMVWSLTCVNALVDPQVAGMKESLATVRALV